MNDTDLDAALAAQDEQRKADVAFQDYRVQLAESILQDPDQSDVNHKGALDMWRDATNKRDQLNQ